MTGAEMALETLVWTPYNYLTLLLLEDILLNF